MIRPAPPQSALAPALGLALACAVALGLSGAAAAHGYMETSAPATNARLPAAPAEIVIRMNEPIVLGGSAVHVIDRAGRDYATGAAFLQDGDARSLARAVALPGNGTYVVTWTALWESDGHTTHGGFGFAVGDAPLPAPYVPPPVGPPAIEESALRFLGYASFALVAGPLLFVTLVWGPVERAPSPRALRALVVGAAIAGLALAVASLAAGARAADAGLAEHAASRLGLAVVARHALLAAAAVAALAAPAWVAAFLGAAAAPAFTATSHSYATAFVPAMVGDAVHLLAGAAWVGGLVALLLAWRDARDRGRLALRFSALATVAVALVVATGVASGLLFLGTPARLFTTPYGLVLLAKVSLVALMLALGAANRWLFTPEAAGTPRPRPFRAVPLRSSPATAQAGLRRVVAAEVAAGLVVLAVAGALAGTPYEDAPAPPGGFAATLLSENAKIRRPDGMSVTLTLEPATVGINVANITLQHWTTGTPIDTTKRVQLFLNKYEEDGRRNSSVPAQAIDLENATSPGTFTGNVTFALAGPWRVTVAVQRTDAVDDAAPFQVRIR